MAEQALAMQNAGRMANPDSQAATSIIEVINRAASDPNTDVDKMERLMAMYERMESAKAVKAFNAALSELQAELPEISEGGKIVHSGRVISEYARWDEDIHPVLRPLLKAHGFALSFRIDTKDSVNVEGVLSHLGGHSERTSIRLPADTSGSKNAVQAVASSVAYGKRYTAGALLNFATGGNDDDGRAAAGPERITAEQVADLEAMIAEVGADTAKFLKYMRVNRLDDISTAAYSNAVKSLEKKRKQA